MIPSSSEAEMRTKPPPHLHRERTRHGAVVWYVRKEKGHRIRLRADYDTPEFWSQYRAAIEGAAPAPAPVGKGTLRWALDRYRASSAWARLSNATRRQRENIYRKVLETAGHQPLAKIDQAAIVAGRERRAATPQAANVFIKAMRAFFRWASDPGAGDLVKVDPTEKVRFLKGRNPDGLHPWTEEEVIRFETHWPVGTRERLALDVLLYTGLRRGDASRAGRQHVRDGVLTMKTEKTGQIVSIPILAPLAASIAATPTGDLTFIVSENGTPFTKESFGNWFRDACRAAGCPGSAHGLRKTGATRAADNGATEAQLMAIFGWTSAKQAAVYIRAANRKRLAAAGAPLMLLPSQNGNELARTSPSGAGDGANIAVKTGA